MDKPYYRNKKNIPAEDYNRLLTELEKQEFNNACKKILFELIENNIFKLNDLYNINHLKYLLADKEIYIEDLNDIKERLFNVK